MLDPTTSPPRSTAASSSSGASLGGLSGALLGATVLGVASAIGDWIWYRFLTDGALAPALGHGLLFFLLLAAVLAATCPRPRAALGSLLLTLPVTGLVLAAVFYPVAYAVGYLPALLITWVAMWLAVALAYDRAAARSGGRREVVAGAALRGVAAAVGSGLAFWAVSGMWTQPSPGGPGVLDHAGRWALAFLPGLVALLWRR